MKNRVGWNELKHLKGGSCQDTLDDLKSNKIKVFEETKSEAKKEKKVVENRSE